MITIDVYDMVAQSAESKDSVQDAPKPGNAAERNVEARDDESPRYTAKQFKVATYNGELPDGSLPMPDRIMWWAYREMYAKFKAGKIGKEQGETEKSTIHQQYAKDRAKYDDYIKVTQRITDLYKRIENAAAAYIKSGNRTPEADALYETLYGVTLNG